MIVLSIGNLGIFERIDQLISSFGPFFDVSACLPLLYFFVLFPEGTEINQNMNHSLLKLILIFEQSTAYQSL